MDGLTLIDNLSEQVFPIGSSAITSRIRGLEMNRLNGNMMLSERTYDGFPVRDLSLGLNTYPVGRSLLSDSALFIEYIRSSLSLSMKVSLSKTHRNSYKVTTG